MCEWLVRCGGRLRVGWVSWFPLPLLPQVWHPFQANHLETIMRDQLQVQETMNFCLGSMTEETWQLCSQSQKDGVKLAVIALQVQEVISSMEERARTVGTNLEEVNSHFDYHGTEINWLKRREKELVKKIVGANHKPSAKWSGLLCHLWCCGNWSPQTYPPSPQKPHRHTEAQLCPSVWAHCGSVSLWFCIV